MVSAGPALCNFGQDKFSRFALGAGQNCSPLTSSISEMGHSRRGRVGSKSGDVRYCAESGSKFRALAAARWVLRSGAPWRDLPATYGPRTTCYNRFVWWRKAGVWDQIMDALAAGPDAAVQMIDTSIIRVHQHGACIADNNQEDMGRSRGGLTSKIHAVVDTNGLPVHLALTPGEVHDNRLCSVLLSALLPQTMLLADRGYDANWIREDYRAFAPLLFRNHPAHGEGCRGW
jgi:transposase